MIDAGVHNSRESLLRAMPKGGVWAEVGVASGGFSKKILEVVRPEWLVLIDAWDQIHGLNEEQLSNARHGLGCVFAQFRASPLVNIVQCLSVQAAKEFVDGSFDVVYIDADHLKAYDDAEAWWPKVIAGGYLCGHDYIDPERWESENFITVKADIDRFASERQLAMTVTNEQYGTWLIYKK